MKIEVELNINLGLSPVLMALVTAALDREQAKYEQARVDQGATAADEPAAPKATRGRPKKDAPKPDAPADPAPAEAAQDAADEKAEQEAVKAAEAAEKPPEAQPKFGQEDMRAAGKAYAEAYGMEACLEDIPAIIGYAAFKLVPEDKFDEATRAVQAAVAANPNNRAKKA